jgi:integrase
MRHAQLTSKMNQRPEMEGEAYSNFINSVNSDITRREYNTNFSYFMKFCQVQTYEDMLLIPITHIESKVRDYIVLLRHTRKLSPATVHNYITPIIHFYEMNGIVINWKRLKKFKAKVYNVIEDRPYNREQIKTLIETATLRDKCIILVMCSAGLRRGALAYLRLRDITKIEKYNLHKINVYKKEQESYTTFCTPECARYIDQYLDWRERAGEKITPNSPLFRIEYSINHVNRPKAVSAWVVAHMIHQLLNRTGVRVAAETRVRTELMQTHCFRKFFKTTCINAGMNPLYSEYVMGHRTGLTKAYFKPTDKELLEGNDKALGYVATINDLTINEEYRLHKKIDEITKKKDEIELREIKHRELKSMREEMEKKFQQIITKIDASKLS